MLPFVTTVSPRPFLSVASLPLSNENIGLKNAEGKIKKMKGNTHLQSLHLRPSMERKKTIKNCSDFTAADDAFDRSRRR